MLRTTLAKAYLKRTIRPLYGWTQTTPKSLYLDPVWDRSVAIWPGMVLSKTAGDNVTLYGSAGVPYGLSALYIGGDGIDEPLDAGVNAVGVWVLGPDAEFEILAPAFDTTQTWTDIAAGSVAQGATAAPVLVYASTTGSNRGKLVPAGGTNAGATPVARLLKVNSATKITIGGLSGTTAG